MGNRFPSPGHQNGAACPLHFVQKRKAGGLELGYRHRFHAETVLWSRTIVNRRLRCVESRSARGAVALDGEALREGDGAAVSDERAVKLTGEVQAELLLFDLA